MASAQEEAKKLLLDAWNSSWAPDLSGVSDFYNDDAELSSFTPPKQTTFSGLEAMKAHFKEIQPIISCKVFNITKLDLVGDGSTFYAQYDAEFEIKIPGQEGVISVPGLMYCVKKGGKIQFLKAWEDPTAFVTMAIAGAFGPPPPPA